MAENPAKPAKIGVIRALSALMDRIRLSGIAGLQFGGDRDLYNVFGYKKVLKPEDFYAKYVRQDIASRIIDAPPAATWSNGAIIREQGANDGADFEKKFDALAREVRLWPAMNRADRLARLGSFSLLYCGFDDTSDPSKPVVKANKLLYVKPIAQALVGEIKFVTDRKNPNYGKPEMYTISFDKPQLNRFVQSDTKVSGLETIKVHASRCIHITEDPLVDDVFADPIIVKCFNLLDDLLKVAGGTAETFWLTANRGIQADIDKEMEIDATDAAALSDALEEYQHQLRRIIKTRGVELNVLDSTTPNPKEVFEMIIALLSGTTGIPKRILLGSEAGQLASEQDRANWAERVDDRRKLYAQPYILEPTVNLLMKVGILEQKEYDVIWPEAFRLSPLEKAQTMAQVARAIANISRQTNTGAMQLTTREEAREIIGLKGDLSDEDVMLLGIPKGMKVPGVNAPMPGSSKKPNGDKTPEQVNDVHSDRVPGDKQGGEQGSLGV